MKNNLKRIASLALAVTVLLCSLLFSSCGAPKLEDVKDDFTRLIKESYGINAILFGGIKNIFASKDVVLNCLSRVFLH